MKLQDRLPDGVTVDGKFYKLDFDFRNVLNMMDEMSRDDLLPEARVYNAVKCLTKRPKNAGKVRFCAAYAIFAARSRCHVRVKIGIMHINDFTVLSIWDNNYNGRETLEEKGAQGVAKKDAGGAV